MRITRDQDRMPPRLEQSPLDISTVVSIFPIGIHEKNHTLFPGDFRLDAGSLANPTVCVVRPASWFRDVDPDQQLIEVPTPSTLIAKSVVQDYCNGIPECDMINFVPGLFWVLGEQDSNSILKKFPHELAKADGKQNAWYRRLVEKADSDWARSNGNPRAISSHAKLAAQMLGFEKEWLKDAIKAEQMGRCKACTTFIRLDAVICPNCKIILNVEKAKELGLKFAS